MAPTATIPETTGTTVCDPRNRLVGLLGQVEKELARIDPHEVLARHAPEVWDLCDRGEKLFTGAKVRMAHRVEASGVHKHTAAGSTAEYLALRSGTSNQAAADMLAASRHLQDLPATEAAVRSGQLSATQAHLVASAAAVNPGKEARLLGLAKNASNKELRDEALRAKAEADPDPEATRDRHRRQRCFRQGTTADGAWWFSGRGPADDAGKFNAVLNRLLDETFRRARTDGRREPREAYAYDASQQMARLARHASIEATPTSHNHGDRQQNDQADNRDRQQDLAGERYQAYQPERGDQTDPTYHASSDRQQSDHTDQSDSPDQPDQPRRDNQQHDRQREHPDQPVDQPERGGQQYETYEQAVWAKRGGLDCHAHEPDQIEREHPRHDHADQTDQTEGGDQKKQRDRSVDGAGIGTTADSDMANAKGEDPPAASDANRPTSANTNPPDADSTNRPDVGGLDGWTSDEHAPTPSATPGTPDNRNADHRGSAVHSTAIARSAEPQRHRPSRPAPTAGRIVEPDSPPSETWSGPGRATTPATRPGRRPNLNLLPVVRLDLAALRRGRLLGNEICEITGVGPITLPAARELLGESVVKLVLSKAGSVVTVAHVGVAPTDPTHLVILHADITTLTDGAIDEADTTSAIQGAGLVPTDAARQRLGKLFGRDLLDQALTRGCDVANLTHLGRRPTTAQRIALLWAQPTCTVAGCPRTFAQIDHRVNWSKQNVTALNNLDRLCPRHHQLKTTQNYQLVDGSGDRAFVPPTDPRHPDNHHVDDPDRASPHAA